MSARAFAAVLTSEGRGAVAVVRVWGPEALTIVDAAFRPARGRRLAETRAGHLRFGRMGAGLGDEVVAVVLGGEPPEVEIHCHGGPAPLAMVVAALIAAGAEALPPSEWVARINPSRLAAAATLDLTRAPTLRTAETLLEQAGGALDDEIRRILEMPGDVAEAALAGLDALIGRSTTGLRLVSGWRVVLAGRPNVGKSALMNALAGYERAIVDPTPGTTRDVVTVRLAMDGWPVELADTAGLRPSDDPIEAAGVALARARQQEADLVLLVLDRSGPITDADRGLLAEHPGALLVASKVDLAAAWEPTTLEALPVSAERGDGIETLLAAIAARLVPDPPPAGVGVPFRPEQLRALVRARRLVAGGRREAAIRWLGRWLAR